MERVREKCNGHAVTALKSVFKGDAGGGGDVWWSIWVVRYDVCTGCLVICLW